jgi:hypothetical protein
MPSKGDVDAFATWTRVRDTTFPTIVLRVKEPSHSGVRIDEEAAAGGNHGRSGPQADGNTFASQRRSVGHDGSRCGRVGAEAVRQVEVGLCEPIHTADERHHQDSIGSNGRSQNHVRHLNFVKA